MDTLKIISDTFSSEATLEERVGALENMVEDLFYSLITTRLDKKSIEEIVELAILEHFKVDRKDFFGKVFTKPGRRVSSSFDESNIVNARNWFISIMRAILLKSTYSLSVNYPFYHTRKENRFRKTYESALIPKTSEDKENRKTLLAIGTIIKRVCLEEGVLSEDFEYL